MKLSRGKLAYVRVAEISLAIFAALITPVAEARTISAYCGYYEFGRGCRNVNRCPNMDPLRCRQPPTTCEPVHSGIDDADKEVILSAHNRYRSRIATGNYSKLPHASNMLEMEWDDDLARIAQDDANLCVGQSSSSFSTRNEVIDDGPAFPLDDEDNLLWGCLFNKATSRSCTFQSDPRDGWKTKTFFGMGHAESVLESGQSAEMTFEQPIQSSNGRLCVKVEYNKGPNVTGTTDRGVLDLVATPVDRPDRQTVVNLSGGAINLMRTSITLRYNVGVKRNGQKKRKTIRQRRHERAPLAALSVTSFAASYPSTRAIGSVISFSFMVPRGSPAQYVNIYKVLIYEKACYE
ncbi:hypothetical protein HPB51_009615 [Rhipicephalus microplus]|uniref:SCP domain-containing protein n=1 Tax=Rhipicephalus microplus TaxID=6941 RepID=A0A9J6DM17_RHIMP|nr:hypothetical protein HPB51_009615 [Rhipicephalus microplus]